MKATVLLLASASLAHGQIFADFTVTHGTTPLGTFRARLDFDKAPRTCANFIGLATGRRPWIRETTGELVENTPFYNGLTFHRLNHGFIIQGGSQNGFGTDGPGYSILDEYHASLRHSGRYMLSMAKSNSPNSGGSQFFITLAATPALDDKHSVFGEVIEGRSIIDGFTNSTTFPVTQERPVTPIKITNVTISGPSYAAFDLDAPALKLPVLRAMRLPTSYNASTSTFTAHFDRQQSHEYFNSSSTDLRSWTPLEYGFSCDDQPGEDFSITEATLPRFFFRMIDLDYGHLINAPAELNQNNRKLRITNRSGDWVELTLGGGSTGTWTASNSTSGTLSGVAWSDSAPATGYYLSSNSLARLFSLGSLSATFNAPAGTGAWTSLNSVFLSFHSETGGWVEGNASSSSGSIPVNQAFTITP